MAAGKKRVRVFVVSYHLPNGTKVWWKESLSADAAFALGKALARKGYRPSVHGLSFLPSELLSTGTKHRQWSIEDKAERNGSGGSGAVKAEPMWNVMVFDLVTRKWLPANDEHLTFDEALELVRLTEDDKSYFLIRPGLQAVRNPDEERPGTHADRPGWQSSDWDEALNTARGNSVKAGFQGTDEYFVLCIGTDHVCRPLLSREQAFQMADFMEESTGIRPTVRLVQVSFDLDHDADIAEALVTDSGAGSVANADRLVCQ